MADPPARPPKAAVLLHLDADPQPSVFDALVAVDSGVDVLLRHGGVRPAEVRDLVHGLLFTRGAEDLHRSAIFVGGSDVAGADRLAQAVAATFFNMFRVSVLVDPSGCNTTAAATVATVLGALGGSVAGAKAVVLGSGPVGQRVARLLAGQGADVALGSPEADQRLAAADAIRAAVGHAITPFDTADQGELLRIGQEATILVGAGPAGVEVLSLAERAALAALQVAVDLNAVPPAGIAGVLPIQPGLDRDGVRQWGALAIGSLKMKVHKAALRSLFEARDRVLDAEALLPIARSLPPA